MSDTESDRQDLLKDIFAIADRLGCDSDFGAIMAAIAEAEARGAARERARCVAVLRALSDKWPPSYVKGISLAIEELEALES